jgi:cell division protein FtsI (penicillin-binding protein 3)
MAFGYGVSMTPLQTLTFYNAIANDGEMVKPRFIKAIKEWDKTVEEHHREVINKSICSKETAKQVQEMMENTVIRGTADNIYEERFSMAGKTGTCQVEYWKKPGQYISSFAGYFPAEDPKYSCIVVIHKPKKEIGYYGNIVAAPVFKTIAQKIYTDTPVTDEVETINVQHTSVEEEYNSYYKTAQTYKTIMPDLRGLPAMDAVSLLENMGMRVQISGTGSVKSQSVNKGTKLTPNQTITLILS